MKHKIKKTHIAQIIHYAELNEREGIYYGNRKQFWKRHNEIIAWLKDLYDNEYLEKK